MHKQRKVTRARQGVKAFALARRAAKAPALAQEGAKALDVAHPPAPNKRPHSTTHCHTNQRDQ
ncbi:hypothetical protein XACM_4032 [Xanthomonas euvesicatoria pv. citrumelo F1]|nr:hypothetical protein XACM_4032 [Xanthomonas euvesicatoria pv. citrumelo F1]